VGAFSLVMDRNANVGESGSGRRMLRGPRNQYRPAPVTITASPLITTARLRAGRIRGWSFGKARASCTIMGQQPEEGAASAQDVPPRNGW